MLNGCPKRRTANEMGVRLRTKRRIGVQSTKFAVVKAMSSWSCGEKRVVGMMGASCLPRPQLFAHVLTMFAVLGGFIPRFFSIDFSI